MRNIQLKMHIVHIFYNHHLQHSEINLHHWEETYYRKTNKNVGLNILSLSIYRCNLNETVHCGQYVAILDLH